LHTPRLQPTGYILTTTCDLPPRASKGRAPGGKPLQILVIHHDPRRVSQLECAFRPLLLAVLALWWCFACIAPARCSQRPGRSGCEQIHFVPHITWSHSMSSAASPRQPVAVATLLATNMALACVIHMRLRLMCRRAASALLSEQVIRGPSTTPAEHRRLRRATATRHSAESHDALCAATAGSWPRRPRSSAPATCPTGRSSPAPQTPTPCSPRCAAPASRIWRCARCDKPATAMLGSATSAILTPT